MSGLIGMFLNSLDMTSAANDVIVVRHRNGSYRCTPFNVRFGKAKVIRPGDKVVQIEVNGRLTRALMKMGNDGEAFWLEPTTATNPEERAESPLGSPTRSPTADGPPIDGIASVVGTAASPLPPAPAVRERENAIDLPKPVLRCGAAAVGEAPKRSIHNSPMSSPVIDVPKARITPASSPSSSLTPGTAAVPTRAIFPHPRSASSSAPDQAEAAAAAAAAGSTHAADGSDFNDDAPLLLRPPPPSDGAEEQPAGNTGPSDCGGFPSSAPDSEVALGDLPQLPPPAHSFADDLKAELEQQMLMRSAATEAAEREVPRKFAELLMSVNVTEKELCEQQRSSDAAAPPSASASDPPCAAPPRTPLGAAHGGAEERTRRGSAVVDGVPGAADDISLEPPMHVRHHRTASEATAGKLTLSRYASVDAIDALAAVATASSPEAQTPIRFADPTDDAQFLAQVENAVGPGAASNAQRRRAASLVPDSPTVAVSAQCAEPSPTAPAASAGTAGAAEGAVDGAPLGIEATSLQSQAAKDQQEEGDDDDASSTASSMSSSNTSGRTSEFGNNDEGEEDEEEEEEEEDDDDEESEARSRVHYRRAQRPIHSDVVSLRLKDGINTIRYITHTTLRGRVVVEGRIFLWGSHAKLVVSDVDGTITKSDVLGHLFTFIGRDWTHPGICQLYNKVARNGYHFVYLTARSVSQMGATRNFLMNVRQEGGEGLPPGPVITAPDKIWNALTQEVTKRSHEFKILALRNISSAFPASAKPFYAGFGNRIGDVIAYTASGIPKHKIFIIDPHSVVHVCHVKQTYKDLSHLVDETFVPRPHDAFPHESWVAVPSALENTAGVAAAAIGMGAVAASRGDLTAEAGTAAGATASSGVAVSMPRAASVTSQGSGPASPGGSASSALSPSPDCTRSPILGAGAAAATDVPSLKAQLSASADSLRAHDREHAASFSAVVGTGPGGGSAGGAAAAETEAGAASPPPAPPLPSTTVVVTLPPSQRDEDDEIQVDQEFNSFNYWKISPEQLISTKNNGCVADTTDARRTSVTTTIQPSATAAVASARDDAASSDRTTPVGSVPASKESAPSSGGSSWLFWRKREAAPAPTSPPASPPRN